MAEPETSTSAQRAKSERDHFMATLPPYQASESLKPRIDELDLWKCIEDLHDQGYTVVPDVAPPALLDELREVIHRFADESEGEAKGVAAAMLLGRHPAVDEVVLEDEAYVASASPELLSVIGAHVFFGTATRVSGGVDMKKIVQCSLMSKQ